MLLGAFYPTIGFVNITILSFDRNILKFFMIHLVGTKIRVWLAEAM